MKSLFLAVFCVLGAAPAFAAKNIEVSPSILEGTYFCLSLLPQWQIPIPWEEEDNRNQTWGEKRVKGLALDLIYGENMSVTGLGLGLVTCALDDSEGMQLGLGTISDEGYGFQFGLFNYGRSFYGLQLGVMNWAKDLSGVQIGLINVITESPVPVLPVLNLCF